MGKTLKKYLLFDLDTTALKEEFGPKRYTVAYSMIRQFLENCGFEHKQGSGYLSTESISLNQTIAIYQAMTEEMPWLDSCSKTMDVGNVRGFYNLKTLSQNLVADNAVDNSQLELADFDRAFPTVGISHDESMSRRYLMFDLDSASLKKEFGPTRYTLAYSDLREALENRGFEHRQGSGYLSKAPISKNKLIVLYDSLVEELPWLNTCSTAMHFADIGKTFNLKTLARNSSTSISDVEFFRNQGTQKRTSRASAESKPQSARATGKDNIIQFAPRQNGKDIPSSKGTSLASKSQKYVAMANALNAASKSYVYRNEVAR